MKTGLFQSVKGKIIAIMLICWLVPVALMIGVMGFYVGSHHSETTAMNYHDQTAFNVKICKDRLDSTVNASRKASYDGKIIETADRQESGMYTDVTALRLYNEYLSSEYLDNDAVSAAILWMPGSGSGTGEDRDAVRERSASVYNEKAGGTYSRIRSYWDRDHEEVAEIARDLDTKAGFFLGSSGLYMIRNMLDRTYRIRAVLVFILNTDYVFGSLAEYPLQDGIWLRLDDLRIRLGNPEEEGEEDWSLLFDDTAQSGETGTAAVNDDYRWIRDRLYVNERVNGNGYKAQVTMRIGSSVTMYPFIGYPYVLAALILLLIPLLAVILRVLRREVTSPIGRLVECAGEIEEGNLGVQVAKEAPNREFASLTDSFNHMSGTLKQQFDRIYEEEIALREARIMALQFHINPHFMNNTLETINWEARLAGDEKVSRMIEALSVMMNGAMDRSRRSMLPLREEMQYVNAYLYIMKERLGDRLTVETDLSEELMDGIVPRLILQPVIENAIEHGVAVMGQGTVTVEGRREKNCGEDGTGKNGSKEEGVRDGGSREEEVLCLDVYNSGTLGTEDREKISRLLDPDYLNAQESSAHLGIANVNQRLRIIYGGDYGLQITQEGDRIRSRLTMPWQTENKNGQ